jgi:hypothetical protein
MITKLLVGAAIVVSALVVGSAPADAAPSTSGSDPNPFGSLTCNCQEPASVGGQVETQELAGLRDGLSRR